MAIDENRVATAPQSAPAIATEAREVKEVEAAMIIAKRFPRDTVAALDDILNECRRLTLAEIAVYQYPRGGSNVTGPSIRLAETLAQCWGNVQYGLREIERRPGASVIEAFAWDVQRNVKAFRTFEVPHIRSTGGRRIDLDDPRDIYETVANQGQRRVRACILEIVPGDVVEQAVKECEKTLKTSAEVTPEAIAKLVKAFQTEHGVTTEQLERRIGRHLDAITPAQIVELRRVYASLRDGMSTVAAWFDVAVAAEPAPPAARPTGTAAVVAAAQAVAPPLELASEPAPDPGPKPASRPAPKTDADARVLSKAQRLELNRIIAERNVGIDALTAFLDSLGFANITAITQDHYDTVKNWMEGQ